MQQHETTNDTMQNAANCIVSSTGTPFEITGFRTEKFENHDEDASLVDSLSTSPAVEEAFRIFHSIK